jgi:hypothetical protein
MNIHLGIVRACLGDGCRVRLLEAEVLIDVRVDGRAGDRTRLRYGFLAAVDMAAAPEIVWHWQRAQVLVWRTGSVLAVLPEGRLVECHHSLSTPVWTGAATEVWVTRVGGAWEVHDAVVHGRPAHPEALIQWLAEQPMAEHV